MDPDTRQRADEVLDELEGRDRRMRDAITETNANMPEDPDDYYVEVAGRLELPITEPTFARYHDETYCETCGTMVASTKVHTRWHARIQAVTKVALQMSELAWKHSGLLGFTLSTTMQELITVMGEDDEWTCSGHGWIYPEGDPPGSVRARCGGPAMCDKCRADEQHSIAEGDGAAQAYYVAMQERRADGT